MVRRFILGAVDENGWRLPMVYQAGHYPDIVFYILYASECVHIALGLASRMVFPFFFVAIIAQI